MTELDPADRVVVISGAGTGIGQVAAVKFAALGWRVAVGGRRADKLAETVALAESAGGRCLGHELDVTDGESVRRFFAATQTELGSPTAIINNAAMARYGPMDDFSPAEIQAEIATKLIGGLFMAREGIRAMRHEGAGGDILFVSSLAGTHPWPRHLPYAAANAGIEHAARTLRLELEGTGIRVTILRVGETLGTDFATREAPTERMAEASDLWFRRGLLRHTGLMTPDLVADAMVTAITLPRTHQYDIVGVTPMAPIGELPRTHEEWGVQMTSQFAPDAAGPQQPA
jgi:NAD(P)-dependent dehydrogenase (short-subunit alcohol dehydrogenase family)